MSRTVHILILALAPLVILGFATSASHATEPTWFKKKKAIQEEKAEEERRKNVEAPVVGNSNGDTPAVSDLSAPAGPPPDMRLLFKRAGVTESFHLDYGNLSQPEITGGMISGQYSFGRWWTSSVILSLSARASGLFQELDVFMMANVGPQVKYWFSQRWAVDAYLGYGISQGLNRVDRNHVPLPPKDTVLRARHGPLLALELSYFFWPKRDMGIAPTVSYWKGSQDERNQSMISLGVTIQMGRPNYTGDVTSW